MIGTNERKYNRYMIDILREHATILRALADESDAVADMLEREAGMTVPRVRDTLHAGAMDYEPQRIPIQDPDNSPSDLRVAVPDGEVDVTYNISKRINFDSTLAMAVHDAKQGKIVRLSYEDTPERNLIMTQDNWYVVAVEAPRP